MHGAQRGGASCHSEPVRTLAWESVSKKRKTDCRIATRREASTLGVLLAMTARRCCANGTSYPKGICSAALHGRTPSPTDGSPYHPVGRGPRAPPKNAYPAAGHMGPALQVHTPKKTTRRPTRGAARFPSMCGTDGGGLYSPLYASGEYQKFENQLFTVACGSLPVTKLLELSS